MLSLKNKTYNDKLTQNVSENERNLWFEFMKIIIPVIKFLGKQNLAFRGKIIKLFQHNNGNLRIEMFDPFISEHTIDSEAKKMPNSLGDKIQNKILTLLDSFLKYHPNTLVQHRYTYP